MSQCPYKERQFISDGRVTDVIVGPREKRDVDLYFDSPTIPKTRSHKEIMNDINKTLDTLEPY
jgi:hypothetical protein